MAVDVTTLVSGGSMVFARTGTSVSAAVDSYGGKMLGFAGFNRSYTRLKTDTSTGAET